jgi:Tol biopolymer transport system component
MKYLIPLLFLAVIAGCSLLGSDSDDEPPSFAFESLSGTFVFAAHDSVSGRRQIYTMNHHGLELDEQVQITFDEHHKEYPAWSPDMEKIIYGSAEGGTSAGPAIWIMNPDGENREPLYIYQSGDGMPEGWFKVGRYPRWSPDMQQIVFGGGFQSSELYLFDIPSQQQIRTESGSSSRHYSWSPDGTRITYSKRVPEGEPGIPYDQFVIDVNGVNPQQLTNEGTLSGRAVWLNENTFIVGSTSLPHAKNLYIIDLENDSISELETNLPFDNNFHALGLSSDGKTFLAGSVTNPATRFYMVDIETRYTVALDIEMEIPQPHIDWIETPVP